jgi:hypothetical protein
LIRNARWVEKWWGAGGVVGRERGVEEMGERSAYPFSIAVFVLAIRFVEIYTVQTADCEGEDELYEAEDGMRDVAKGHFAASYDTHVVCIVGDRISGFSVRGVDFLVGIALIDFLGRVWRWRYSNGSSC